MLTRNNSSLIAFHTPAVFDSNDSAFNIIAAHTDSPYFKLAPVSLNEKGGYKCLNIIPYGGGLWSSWFDRDLTIDGKITSRLVHIEKPLLRIPTLTIHFGLSR